MFVASGTENNPPSTFTSLIDRNLDQLDPRFQKVIVGMGPEDQPRDDDYKRNSQAAQEDRLFSTAGMENYRVNNPPPRTDPAVDPWEDRRPVGAHNEMEEIKEAAAKRARAEENAIKAKTGFGYELSYKNSEAEYHKDSLITAAGFEAWRLANPPPKIDRDIDPKEDWRPVGAHDEIEEIREKAAKLARAAENEIKARKGFAYELNFKNSEDAYWKDALLTPAGIENYRISHPPEKFDPPYDPKVDRRPVGAHNELEEVREAFYERADAKTRAMFGGLSRFSFLNVREGDPPRASIFTGLPLGAAGSLERAQEEDWVEGPGLLSTRVTPGEKVSLSDQIYWNMLEARRDPRFMGPAPAGGAAPARPLEPSRAQFNTLHRLAVELQARLIEAGYSTAAPKALWVDPLGHVAHQAYLDNLAPAHRPPAWGPIGVVADLRV